MIGGGSGNRVTGNYGTVVGGQSNSAASFALAAGNGSTASGLNSVALGYQARATTQYATAMGYNTLASGDTATAVGSGTVASGLVATAMGWFTTASGTSATAMGNQTRASGPSSTAMGAATTASGNNSVAGGYSTTASGDTSTAFGIFNTASGGFSTALGYNATAAGYGSFVWADATGGNLSSASDNSVTMRATGGYRLFTTTTGTGAELRSGENFWRGLSDRNAKKDFSEINTVDILEKLAAMPITYWRYKWETEDITPHIGPMAQDFKAAFYPGSDDKTISTLEFDGVALAAIQGLNQKLEAQKAENAAENAAKNAEIEQLKQQVAELKAIVNQLVPQK